MAKQCSRCGKTIGFRDTFEYQKAPVCRNCLELLTGPQTSPENKEKKKEPDQTAQMYKRLKSGGIGSIIFGIIAIAFGLASAGQNPINAGLAVIGLFLLAEGIWLLASPQPIGLIVDGIALCVLGIWNMMITIYNTSHAGGGGGFAILGIMQIVWGIQSFRHYHQLKLIAPPAVSTVPPEKVREFHQLFDPDFSRANLIIGFFFVGAWFASSLLLPLVRAVYLGSILFLPLIFYCNTFLFYLGSAFLLIILGHRFRDPLPLVFFFSLGCLIIHVIIIAIFFQFDRGNQYFATFLTMKPGMILSILLWNMILIGALYFIIRQWGISPLPLLAGMGCACLAAGLVSQVINLLLIKGTSFSMTFPEMIVTIIDGTIFGGAMYLGFSTALKNRTSKTESI